jgi:hypothetical protein
MPRRKTKTFEGLRDIFAQTRVILNSCHFKDDFRRDRQYRVVEAQEKSLRK